MTDCTWPVDYSCGLDAEPGSADEALQEQAVQLAVSTLFKLSGSQFGCEKVIARPCIRVPIDSWIGGGTNYMLADAYGPGWFPVWQNGQWQNVSCGCAGRCQAYGDTVVHLPAGVGRPVIAVSDVVVNGESLTEDQWALEGALLYRVGGRWPQQDLTKPNGQIGTWSVAYTRGRPVPLGVGRLTALLAKEFKLACAGGKCRLPNRVTSIARKGVTIQRFDPSAVFAKGLTGIPEVDMWLSAVNPTHMQQASAVL